VIVELGLSPEEALASAQVAYSSELARMRAALGFQSEREFAWSRAPLAPSGCSAPAHGGVVEFVTRPHHGGAVIGYQAPIDVMLACAEMSEWAGMSTVELLGGREPLPLEPKRAEIAAMLASQESPLLLALQAEAARRNLPFLWDDVTLTIGMGTRSASFPIMPRSALPSVDSVPWETLGTIPTALVTGTNGKTTSTRLLARVCQEAGYHVGTASTGEMVVNGVTLDHGDWTGPAAARTILSRNDVDMAVLETARGGILRRGLAMDECSVALMTNVSDDHLGLYGIDDLEAMVQVKGVIAKAVGPGGAAVLSADDPRLVAFASSLRSEIILFGLNPLTVPPGRRAVYVRDGQIVIAQAGAEIALMHVQDAPITFGGAADYNVKNVLGVVASAVALGIPHETIARGVRAFTMKDNPGRGQLSVHGGIHVLRDFGHNVDGVRGVMKLVAELRAKGNAHGKLTVVTGAAGDRSDREITDISAAIHQSHPDHVFVRELGNYLRGRAPGEVPELFRRAFVSLGLPSNRFAIAESEVAALRSALDQGAPGDFVVVLVHVEEEETAAFLGERQR
jgi:UDP-N-acetylmuramyl tripeptide synthase